jgi:hypothetical protein
MATSTKRIDDAALRLWEEIYEDEFGGKSRGKFLISRDDLKQLLGVRRLHSSTVRNLADACLNRGLVVIDLDGYFAMVELIFIEKWRRVPRRIIKDHAQELDAYGKDGKDDDEELEYPENTD